jgi:acetyltransferase-like isoleucine patch superfamily enzyme
MMFHIRLWNALNALAFSILAGWRFGGFGSSSKIVRPMGIEGAKNIFLGSSVYVAPLSYLAARPLAGERDCRLEIGDGCSIGRFNHLYATRRVVLGANVLTANGVYISDNLHGYRDVTLPILKQPIQQIGDVEIGEGSWIGHNACILGARIGRHCVVGANAVVTRDLPDHSVAVGAPAIIIRRYDTDTGTWRATQPDGSF